ncbi:MAG: hypothetical protein PHR35_00365 [Kiritimatiellae bacterium]|nr:hypothetical protein [Kiritimatiellia bacterium]
MEGLAKWCYGSATLVRAKAIAGDQALRAVARTASDGYLRTGYALELAAIVAVVVGCVAWRVAVTKEEAGSPVLPIGLLAAYLLLLLLMV